SGIRTSVGAGLIALGRQGKTGRRWQVRPPVRNWNVGIGLAGSVPHRLGNRTGSAAELDRNQRRIGQLFLEWRLWLVGSGNRRSFRLLLRRFLAADDVAHVVGGCRIAIRLQA